MNKLKQINGWQKPADPGVGFIKLFFQKAAYRHGFRLNPGFAKTTMAGLIGGMVVLVD